MNKKKEAFTQPRFEDNIIRLEEISNLLEDEETGLEKAIELFEEGINLSKICLSTLKNAELKITELKKKLDIIETDGDLFDQ